MTIHGNILLVDDDASFIEVYQDLLTGKGYVVSVARDAESALQQLERDGSSIDVVLLDQRLRGPGGGDTGLDLIERIARLAPFAKTIVVTGYATPGSVERAFELGVYDYMEKSGPFETLLGARIRNAVEVTSERRRAALSRDAAARELRSAWDLARTEPDRHRKGFLLEELIKLLFRATPGFEYVTTRVSNDIEEIDVVVENRSEDPLWKQDGGQYIVAECKHWSKPCDRAEFDAFYMKLKRRYQRVRTGFFIAPGGFTAGFDEARRRATNGYVVVPVDAADLERWITADDRAAVLRELHRRAVFDQA